MGYYDKDLYYNAEDFGLESVGTIDLEEPNYSFDILAVLYNPERKNFYIITDSGCSCPSPFESFTTLADAGPALTAHEAVAAVRAAVAAAQGYGYSKPEDPSDLIAAIMRRN